MYLPRAFAESDLIALDQLVERDPFATLVTVDGDGAPFASHLPVLYQRDGEHIVLRGHWARPNPQWRHTGTALAIVHGPHAYISPSWYVDKEEAARVPTWNYALAHLRGELVISEEPAELADIVARLSERHEATVGQSWRFEPERDDHARQLRGIVGFRLEVQRVELKFKLNQNHPAANVRAAADGLRALGRHQDDEVAALMLDRLDRREP